MQGAGWRKPDTVRLFQKLRAAGIQRLPGTC